MRQILNRLLTILLLVTVQMPVNALMAQAQIGDDGLHKADWMRDTFKDVVQLNLHGDVEVTDFDGETLSEKAMARKWGVLFTPSMYFMPQEVEAEATAVSASVAMMPGAFGRGTTFDMLTWVKEKRYEIEDGEDFQRYHARQIQIRAEKRQDGSTD